jgi:hypothetical protein
VGLDHLLILNVSRRNGRRKERIYLSDIPSAFKGFQHLLRLLIYYTRTHAHRGTDIQTQQTQTQTQTRT